MSDIYAMQRANGDVFALDHNGGFCVPLFHSSSDAMTARSRNTDMLLFKPTALNDRLLREIGPTEAGSDVALLLVKDPLRNLKHGRLLDHAELVLLVGNSRDSLLDNELGPELKDEVEDEEPVSESLLKDTSPPLFMRDSSEGKKGNAQDEKDETAE